MRSSTHARLIALRPFKNAVLVCAAASLYALQAGAAAAQAPKQGTAVKTLVSRTVAKPAALYAYDIGNIGSPNGHCAVSDINDSGQVAGSAGTPDGHLRAFLTGPRGQGIRDLGSIEGPGVGESSAVAVNNDGVVVGYSSNEAAGGWSAMMTQANGEQPYRPASDAPAYVTMIDVNSQGDAVGQYTDADYVNRSIFISNHGMNWQEIKNSDGLSQIWVSSINDGGQIVGNQNIIGVPGVFQSYLLNAIGDEPVIMAPLPDQSKIWAIKVNNRGQVVHGTAGQMGDNGKLLNTKIVKSDMAGQNIEGVGNRKQKIVEPKVNDYSIEGLMVGYIRSPKLFKEPWSHNRAWAVDEAGNEWNITQMLANRPKGMYFTEVKAVNKHHQMAVEALTQYTEMPHCFIVCPTENCVVPGQAAGKGPAGKR